MRDIFFSFVSYVWYKSFVSLVKKVKKLLGLNRVIENTCYLTNIFGKNMLNLYLEKYVIIKGTTEKLINRDSPNMNPNVILSYGNYRYIEAFLLNLKTDEKVLVQPDLGTKVFNLEKSYIKSENNWIDKIWNVFFYQKTPVLLTDQKVLIYGKLTKNNMNTIIENDKYVSIIPKFIDKSSHPSSYFDNYRSLLISKVEFQLLGFLVISSVLVNLFTYFYWLKIKNFIFKVKERKRIYCKICNEKPCNILCEECDSLNEFCSVCFKSLENLIIDGKIELKDIRCCNCSKVLEKAQILMYS